jgi:hypothetical protein
MSRLVGVALTRYMDGRTDRVIPIYPPPNFVCGGYKYEPHKTNESKHEPNIVFTCESYQHHSTERDNM